MKIRKKVYLVHRWLGLIISLQLLAWSIGGLVFSLLDIEDVRGDRDKASRVVQPLDTTTIQLSPSEAMQQATRSNIETSQVKQVILREVNERPSYVPMASPQKPMCTIDATSGAVSTRIAPEVASDHALADFAHDATVTSIEFIEDNPPNEYRGKRLPAYQVVLNHPKQPHIYICAVTGDVTSRRNARWRLFDFFWMLHIMDYDEREDFNHWLLTIASMIAVLTSITGLSLWAMRLWPVRFKTRGD